MRRPVKPFVTEYKGSARRGKDNRPEADVEDSKPAEPARRAAGRGASGRAAGEGRGALPPRGLFHGGEEGAPIDSYEAAMRAADALFSPKDKVDHGEPASNGRASGRRGAAPAAPDTQVEASAEAPADTAEAKGAAEQKSATEQKSPAEPKGRVLRALDEPEPEIVDPLPELAPKRRGRKPGSLNKRKPEVTDGARRRLAETVPEPSPEEDEEEPAEVAAAVVAPPRRAPAVPATRTRDRFPWVRTKLRPGEKWKRRLPKVAW